MYFGFSLGAHLYHEWAVNPLFFLVFVGSAAISGQASPEIAAEHWPSIDNGRDSLRGPEGTHLPPQRQIARPPRLTGGVSKNFPLMENYGDTPPEPVR